MKKENKIIFVVIETNCEGISYPFAAYSSREKAEMCKNTYQKLYSDYEYEIEDFPLDGHIIF